ncbi:MarR family winged helix-turn-helix transcriptional regulator [Streptomyces zagrosensis]|uniref:DNA-binding MarR family transcriptional regulator n=1 Tax=Streptomyces zagrosensis TaxID=1042984 RepID=A0A7W9V1X2_9ACTN|nr:MarR family transcriptional regulator [Streptomyces zagrosensis]MBB5939645.1 DNA-binding MarR family transcriptional regulator [Streptomyces zagrosensis]
MRQSPVDHPRVPPMPAPTTSRTGMLLLTAGRLVREEIDHALEAQGLSLRHLSALGHLSREPGLSYSALARRAGVTAQSMQATVRQLEKSGSVTRESPVGRGRTAELRVTAHGRETLSELDGVLRAAEEPLLEGLSQDERAALAKGLRQVLLNGWRSRHPESSSAPPGAAAMPE